MQCVAVIIQLVSRDHVCRFENKSQYATFIFNVIKIVQKRLENGSFDGSRCVLYNAFVLARRIDLDVATICYIILRTARYLLNKETIRDSIERLLLEFHAERLMYLVFRNFL
jgi:hypothetical protein